jgi:2-oxoglutarate dehydrogenase E2 component (dihydrolipoamide succinyltransferase)
MFELKMPKMGESIEQATITKWFVKEGDTIVEDDVLLEIATDKVDSEIPSPVAGTITKIFFQTNDLVPVGKVIALINTNDDVVVSDKNEEPIQIETKIELIVEKKSTASDTSTRFYSPLVKSIAKKEGVSITELESIAGTGENGRLRKQDLLKYISSRGSKTTTESSTILPDVSVNNQSFKASQSIGANDEIIEMDRMRKLIAEHMVSSKRISPHVTNMVEADVTELVKWRERMKEAYQSKYKTKLTYMPAFTEAAARALRDFPMVNASVDVDKIIVKGKVNIGIAVSKPDGNLIVPVVRNADRLNMAGLSLEINRLAEAARTNKLSPDDIQEGTFSITNFGTFRNVMGTPIIAQPQVAILATGTIEKKPAVVETEYGDIIVPRHKMFLSLSYDHRIIDGALGGAFLRRVADYLEKFDSSREF